MSKRLENRNKGKKQYFLPESSNVNTCDTKFGQVSYLELGSSDVIDDVALSSVQRFVRLLVSDTGDFFVLLE